MSFAPSINLTPEQMEERRMQGLALLREGVPQAEIARRLGVTRGAVHKWKKAAKGRGAKALARRPHTGRNPKLDHKLARKLPAMLSKGAEHYGFEGDVWTLERIATLIAREFKVDYHSHHVSKILHRLGLVWKKPLRRPHNRDDEAIAEWVHEEWPRLKNARRSSEQ